MGWEDDLDRREDELTGWIDDRLAHSVSGACAYCFTGFGDYHEPQCPRFILKAPLVDPAQTAQEEG